jgi:xanthosine utilization system XapX-like protein
MKTVWHWKNIGKVWLVVIAAGILFGFVFNAINIPEEISFLLCVLVGFGAMTISLIKWDLWHFE